MSLPMWGPEVRRRSILGSESGVERQAAGSCYEQEGTRFLGFASQDGPHVAQPNRQAGQSQFHVHLGHPHHPIQGGAACGSNPSDRSPARRSDYLLHLALVGREARRVWPRPRANCEYARPHPGESCLRALIPHRVRSRSGVWSARPKPSTTAWTAPAARSFTKRTDLHMVYPHGAARPGASDHTSGKAVTDRTAPETGSPASTHEWVIRPWWGNSPRVALSQGFRVALVSSRPLWGVGAVGRCRAASTHPIREERMTDRGIMERRSRSAGTFRCGWAPGGLPGRARQCAPRRLPGAGPGLCHVG